MLTHKAGDSIKARIGLWTAAQEGDDIVINGGHARIATLRQQHIDGGGNCTLSLSDFISPQGDYVATFAVTAGCAIEQIIGQYRDTGDDYHALLLRTVADRLAEAATELTHRLVASKYWGYGNNGQHPIGIRPAIGYPSLPDQSVDLIFTSPPYYNARKQYSEYASYEDYLLQMLNLGYFEVAYNEKNHLKITEAGKKVLFGQERAQLVVINGKNMPSD